MHSLRWKRRNEPEQSLDIGTRLDAGGLGMLEGVAQQGLIAAIEQKVTSLSHPTLRMRAIAE